MSKDKKRLILSIVITGIMMFVTPFVLTSLKAETKAAEGEVVYLKCDNCNIMNFIRTEGQKEIEQTDELREATVSNCHVYCAKCGQQLDTKEGKSSKQNDSKIYSRKEEKLDSHCHDINCAFYEGSSKRMPCELQVIGYKDIKKQSHCKISFCKNCEMKFYDTEKHQFDENGICVCGFQK